MKTVSSEGSYIGVVYLLTGNLETLETSPEGTVAVPSFGRYHISQCPSGRTVFIKHSIIKRYTRIEKRYRGFFVVQLQYSSVYLLHNINQQNVIEQRRNPADSLLRSHVYHARRPQTFGLQYHMVVDNMASDVPSVSDFVTSPSFAKRLPNVSEIWVRQSRA